jgi:PAS domain S-box-containing protein
MNDFRTSDKVLIVDAVMENQHSLLQLLTDSGYKVRTVEMGKEALSSILTDIPDLILLNVKLPDISGFDVCKRLKGNDTTKSIPIIFICDLSDATDKLNVFTAGAVDYITKPVSYNEVTVRVKNHLEMNRLRRELEYTANELRQKNKDDFKELFDEAPVGYHEINAEGRIVRINKTELDMLGYSFSEVIGQYFWKFIADETVTKETILMKLSGKLTPTESYERTFRRKDGTALSVLVTDKLLKTADGKITGIRSNVQDITPQKRAEEQLKQSETLHRAITHTAMDGFWLVNTEGKILEANESISNITGYSIPELLQMYVADIEQKDDQKAIEARIASLETEGSSRFESQLRRKDGKIIDVEVSIQSQPHSAGNIIAFLRDISEQKQVYNELTISEEKFKKAFTTIPDSININRMDDGTYLMINRGFENILGYSESEVFEKKPIELGIWYDVSDRKKWLKELNRTGEVRNFETRFRTKDGRVIYVLVSATIIELDGIKHVLSITRNITERKDAENKVLESEEKFRHFFEYSVVGKSITGFNGRLKVNKAFCDIVGYSEDELNQLSWQAITYPEDIDFKQKEIEKLLNGIKKSSTFESRFIHKNGSIVWTAITTVLLRNTEGKPDHFITTIQDITQKKLAEEALRLSEEKLSTFFGAMTEMVVMHELVFDDEGKPVDYRIIDCNNAFTRIIGIRKEDAINQLATELYHTSNALYLDEYSKVAITGESFEFDTHFAPMSKHFRISVVSPRKNVFATITSDITQIKQIQEEILLKNKELESYLYIASHDLRSPLVNIQGFSQRLLKQTNELKSIITDLKPDSQVQMKIDTIINEGIPKSLHFILSNVVKMDSLISSLLQISRTGRLTLSISKVDMNRLFKTIVASQDHQLTECSAQIRMHRIDDCYGDENLLNQLFSNIIDNAIKYRDKDRNLLIELESKVQYKNVIYSIKDNGRGISKRNLEKIWDVFFRVDTQEKGEGIGLSIAKTITSKHKGKIWVESEEGVGSTFFVELQQNEFTE